MREPSDAELVARDTRISATLANEIMDLRSQARDARDEAARLERLARDIEQTCAQETWWKLSGILSANDIESLCQLSPTNLLTSEG